MQPVPTHFTAPRLMPLACMLMLLVCNSGCMKLMANMIYVIKGRDNPAEFDGLIEKKVAVLVSSNGVHSTDASNVLLARNINLLLQTKVKKITMVSQDEVDRLVQNQPLGKVDANMIGERLGVDFVIDVDVRDLKLYEGKTLYKGQSSSSITVYQCKPKSEVVFAKTIPDYTYPKHGAPVTDFDEASFRRFYLMTLAEQISRVFYPYDPITDVAREAAVSSM